MVVAKSVETGFKLHARLMTVITTLKPYRSDVLLYVRFKIKYRSALMMNDWLADSKLQLTQFTESHFV